MELVDTKLRCPVKAAQVALAYFCMSDRPTQPVEVIVVHGLSDGMYQSGDLFKHATAMQSEYDCPIAISVGDGRPTGKSAPTASWIGFEALIEGLQKAGARMSSIIKMDSTTNSKEEARAIIKMAKANSFHRVGSVSVAYHGGRMFPYMVAAMRDQSYWLAYHMLPPATTDWWLPILGSQGRSMTTCLEASLDDAVKIEQHITDGFAASFEETFHYLRYRDNIVLAQKWELE